MALDVARARACRRDARARAGAARAASWRRASCASPTRTWSAPFASCRSSAATTRAGSRWSRSAAPAACTRARSRARSTSATVLVPRHAGVLSALGMLVADVTRDYSASVLRAGDRSAARDLDAALCAARVARAARTSAARDLPAARVSDRAADGRALRRAVVRDHRAVPADYPRGVRSPARPAVRLRESRARRRGRGRARPRRRTHRRSRAAVHADPRRVDAAAGRGARQARFDGTATCGRRSTLGQISARRARAWSSGHHRWRGDRRRAARVAFASTVRQC